MEGLGHFIPDVVLRIMGDVSDLKAKMGEATGHVQTYAKATEEANTRTHASFIKGGEAVATFATGAGFALLHLSESQERAHIELEQTITNAGFEYDRYSGKIDETVRHMEKYGHTSDDTMEAIARLTMATKDPAKALKDMSDVADLAAVRHESLTQAAIDLGRALNGSPRLFKQFGINVNEMKDVQKAAAKATDEHTKAVDALAKAQQHLTDLKAVQAANVDPKTGQPKALTVTQQIELRKAQEAVTVAQQRVTVTTANVTQSQNKLNDAVAQGATAQKQLHDRIHGTADALSNTLGGRIDWVKSKIMDLTATFGQFAAGPLMAIGGGAQGLVAMAGIGGWAKQLGSGFMGRFRAERSGIPEEHAGRFGSSFVSSGGRSTVIRAAEGAGRAEKGFGVASMLTTMGGPAVQAAKGITAAIIAMTVAEEGADAAGMPLAATLGIIVLVAAAVAVAGYLIYKNWDKIEPVLKAVGNYLLKVFKTDVLPVVEAVGRVFATVFKAVVGAVETAAKWIKVHIDQILMFIGPLGWILIAIHNHWRGFFQLIAAVVKGFIDVVKINVEILVAAFLVVKGIVEFVAGIFINQVKTIWAVTAPIWRLLAAIVVAVFKVISTVVETEIKFVYSVISAVIRTVVSFWTSNWHNMAAVASAVWAIVSGVVRAGLQVVAGIFDFFMHLFQGHWREAWNSLISHLGGALATILGQVWNAMAQLPGLVARAVSGIGNWLYQAGKDLIMGLVNGLKSLASAPLNALKGIGKDAVNGFKHFFGIGSPSRLMMEYGAHIGHGLALGIQGTTGLTLNAVRAHTEGALGAGVRFPGGGYGGTTVNHFHIQGHVLTERQLFGIVQKQALRSNARNVNNGLTLAPA